MPLNTPQGPLWNPDSHPLTIRTTPGWLLPETLHRNAMFVVWTATEFPSLSVEITAIEDLGGGLLRDVHLGVVETVRHRPERLQTWIPGNGAREAEWIVRGWGRVVVRYDGVRSGGVEVEGRL